MCLLVLAWQAHSRYRLVVAANRDEYHARPAASLSPWKIPEMLAGRDLLAGGTWLGVDRRRRFGIVTNFRDLQQPKQDAPSRGQLVPDYLGAAAPAATFLAQLSPFAQRYSGFNLLLTDEHSLWYACNRAASFAQALAPGVYGLSNEFLDTPWPKLQRVKARFGSWLQESDGTPEELFAMLGDRTPSEAPAGEAGSANAEWDRALSAPFVRHDRFGTRSSTVLLLDMAGALRIVERRFDEQGNTLGEAGYVLAPDEWP